MTKLIEQLREQKRELIRALALSNEVLEQAEHWASRNDAPIAAGTVAANKELIREMEGK